MPMDRFTGKRIDELNHIHQCIGNVLLTPKTRRVMNPEYGADLLKIADVPLNADGRALIRAESLIPVKRHEQRPEYKRVTLGLPENSDGTLNLAAGQNGEVVVTIEWKHLGESGTTITSLFSRPDTDLPTGLPASL